MFAVQQKVAEQKVRTVDPLLGTVLLWILPGDLSNVQGGGSNEHKFLRQDCLRTRQLKTLPPELAALHRQRVTKQDKLLHLFGRNMFFSSFLNPSN